MRFVYVLLIVLLCGLRFYHIDADPPLFKSLQDVSDEGYMGSNCARNKIITGSYIENGYGAAIYGHPLTVLILKSWYEFTDVSIVSTRLFFTCSAVLAWLILYLTLLRAKIPKAEISVLILLSSSFLFGINRFGNIENFHLLVISLIYFALTIKNKIIQSTLIGVLVAIGVLAKLTFLLLVPFIVIFFYKKVRKKTYSAVHVFSSITGFVFPMSIAFVLLAINWNEFESLMTTPQVNLLNSYLYSFTHLDKILLKISFFPDQDIFKSPVNILLALIGVRLLFYKKLNSKTSNSSKTTEEIFSFSRLFLGVYLVSFLFSDFSHRRLYILFIPLAVLLASCNAIREVRTFSKSQLILISGTISLFLGSAVYYFDYERYTGIPNSSLIWIVAAITFLFCAFLVYTNKVNQLTVLFVFLISCRLLFPFVFELNTLLILQEHPLVIKYIVLLIILLASAITFLLLSKYLFNSKSALILYFAVSISLIVVNQVNYSNSALCTAEKIQNAIGHGRITGDYIAHQMVFNSKSILTSDHINMLIKKNEFIKLQKDTTPLYILRSTYKGRNSFDVDSLKVNIEPKGKWGIYKINQKPRIELGLYKVIK